MRNLKCILYLGEMFIKATRESIYIRYGLKIPVGKKKSHVFTMVRIIRPYRI